MSPIVREYFRVPREDRAVYIHPAPADLAPLVERNRRAAASWTGRVAGRPVAEFRASARQEIVALARRYTAAWGFPAAPWAEPAPLIVTGHQPPPFHPGVWFKNFLAGSLAGAVGGAAVNLTVDIDEVHAQTLRFPTRAAAGPGGDEVRVAAVALAAPAGPIAFEEQPASALRREALDEVLTLAPAACHDALRRTWAHLVAAAEKAGSLGEAQGIARRRLEAELGLENLELTVSRLADSDAFRLFAAEMLLRHEAFFHAYNDSLAEYRRVYRERSLAQPVPDLGRSGDRHELPLWVWRAGGPRQRLWVEHRAGRLVILADREEVAALDASGTPDAAAAGLATLRREGWKVRPRALAMTLFVRLAVGDVFIHGLGGALYDKIADGLFERFLGVAAPELVLASCTVCLPLETYPATPRDLEAARRAVRDWRFNPDRLPADAVRRRPEAAALIDEKRRLLTAREPTREARTRAWHRVHAINETLAGLAPAGPPAAAARLTQVERELRLNAILRNREYPFCVYPLEDLAAFYRQATRPAE